MASNKDYIEGFNLGFRFQKLTNQDDLKEADKAMLKSMEEVISSISNGSEKMEGFQDGQENYTQAQTIEDSTEEIIPSLDLDTMEDKNMGTSDYDKDIDLD